MSSSSPSFPLRVTPRNVSFVVRMMNSGGVVADSWHGDAQHVHVLAHFIEKERDTLGLEPQETLDKQWVQGIRRNHTRLVKVLLWNFRVLQDFEGVLADPLVEGLPKIRLFSLAPVCSIKAHHIGISSSAMADLLMQSGSQRLQSLGFAANSMRSTSMVRFRAHLQTIKNNHAALWGEKLKRRWGQAVFRTRCLKQKALRRFVVGMWAKSRAGRRAAPIPVIAYGSAHVAATGWGERPVPVKGVRRIVLATYPHVLTDEYNTSKMCCVCGAVLQVVECLKVDRRGRRYVHEIRGMRRCGSVQCKSTSFVQDCCNKRSATSLL